MISRLRSAAPVAATPRSAAELQAGAFANLAPLAVRRATGAPPMLTVVTDTVAPGYLFGGVGTAMLLAASLAAASGRGLRIVTRSHPPEAEPVRRLLALQGVRHDGPIELGFSPHPGSDPVPLGDDDLVLTTSWWSTAAALPGVPADRIVYLLQEDERMFYAGGDQQLLCDETLGDDRIRYVVNTGLLLDHFRATGTRGPAARGVAFEPAFPDLIYHPEPHDGRRRLLFYARPGHPRNLFLRGLAALEAAIGDGLFPAAEWDIHLVGVGIPPVRLDGRMVHYHDTVPWADYAALVRGCDLGLSLMSTPHPSYPPLDMAASGAVVVTNRYGTKQSLSAYSDNILAVPLATGSLVEGLRHGAVLAADRPRRERQHAESRLLRSWAASFAPILDQVLG